VGLVKWRASYTVKADEYARIVALGDLRPADNYLITGRLEPDDTPGDGELAFDLSVDDQDELVVEGQKIFDRIRWRAGLDAAPFRLIGFVEVDRPPWEVALEKALKRLGDGYHEEAVVFAQVACETRATDGLNSLLQRAGIPGKLPSATELRDEPSRFLLTALAGSRIEDEDWWAKYNRHVKRRNLVIHEGADVPRAQAEESLDVARQFRDYIDQLVPESPEQ
jgi:hypothetical protein